MREYNHAMYIQRNKLTAMSKIGKFEKIEVYMWRRYPKENVKGARTTFSLKIEPQLVLPIRIKTRLTLFISERNPFRSFVIVKLIPR